MMKKLKSTGLDEGFVLFSKLFIILYVQYNGYLSLA